MISAYILPYLSANAMTTPEYNTIKPCARAERSHGKKNRRKFSSIKAMVLGAIVTIEIMIMGAMVLKLDFHSADRIALALGFMVLYSGVVIALADK